MSPQTNFNSVPLQYVQPDLSSFVRSLTGPWENVLFAPESHLRIWYNTQTEGYANHYHGAMEIIVCAEHQYIIASNNKTYTLNAGDILMIPPYMLHELYSSPHGSRFIFLIDVSMLQCFQDSKTLGPVFIEPYLCTASTHPDIYEHIHSTLMQMVDIYFSHDIFWETSVFSRLLDIFFTIGRSTFRENDAGLSDADNTMQHKYYEVFANLLNFIDTHYFEDITLEQAASYSGFSKYHFARLFKQHTRTTYHNYLCHKRIRAAQLMLTADAELTITDIAFRVGFNNLTTFCRCFNKYTNCSPTQYREKLRREDITPIL